MNTVDRIRDSVAAGTDSIGAARRADRHGLAVLLLDGPLRSVPEQAREALLERTLATVREGLLRPRSAGDGR